MRQTCVPREPVPFPYKVLLRIAPLKRGVGSGSPRVRDEFMIQKNPAYRMDLGHFEGFSRASLCWHVDVCRPSEAASAHAELGGLPQCTAQCLFLAQRHRVAPNPATSVGQDLFHALRERGHLTIQSNDTYFVFSTSLNSQKSSFPQFLKPPPHFSSVSRTINSRTKNL